MYRQKYCWVSLQARSVRFFAREVELQSWLKILIFGRAQNVGKMLVNERLTKQHGHKEGVVWSVPAQPTE
jgi:hypothetical protein